MPDSTSGQQVHLGFLRIVEVEGAFVGGMLVTNRLGRPLEFQCTTPVTANRTQQILYGPTLRPFLFSELIGRTLVERLQVKPQLLLVSQPELLELREHVAIPVGCLIGPATDAHDLPDQTRLAVGSNSLHFAGRHGGDAEVAQQLLASFPADADLHEPLDRVTEALNETFAPSPESPMTADDRHELYTESLPVQVPGPEVPVTGMNGALRRWPRLEAAAVSLLGRAGFVPRWRPYWPQPRTVGLTFPAGIEFLPPKAEADAAGQELKSIKAPAARRPPAEGKTADKRPTRIRPPADALSLQDRLFYVLQPPLESWLRGQELIMPFEPFPYQYEGIAWLFSQKAALLADEMGLGKTMQTITALRLLLRAGQARRVLLVCPKPLIPNWQREFKLWAEEIPVTTIEGDGPRRRPDLADARLAGAAGELRTGGPRLPGDDRRR